MQTIEEFKKDAKAFRDFIKKTQDELGVSKKDGEFFEVLLGINSNKAQVIVKLIESVRKEKDDELEAKIKALKEELKSNIIFVDYVFKVIDKHLKYE